MADISKTNPHQSYLDWWTAINVSGIICIFDFGVNCPFKALSYQTVLPVVVCGEDSRQRQALSLHNF